jgi:hypothetical protein
MRNLYQASKLPFALTSLCLMLSACGGGSNTINEDPTGNEGGNSAFVECAASDTTCVDLVFDDTPVVNLNYECGKYRSVTSNTGVARCPADSNVTFYLKATDGTRKIVLGKVAVKPVRNTISSEIQNTSLIRITTKDLAESTTSSVIASLDESAAAKAAINISQLLQSIARTNRADPTKPYASNNEFYVANAPVNRVYIDTDVKADIEKMTEDVEAKDFQDNTFISKTKPWLEAQKIKLISNAEAKRRLEQVIMAKNAGVFYATPTLDLSFAQNLSVDLKLGVSGSDAGGNTASVAMFALTDRTGDSTGYGLEWINKAPDNDAKYKMFLTSKYSKMRLATNGNVFNAYTNRFNNFSFDIGPKAYETGADGTTYEGNKFNFVNGKLIRDLAVLASADVHNLYTGETIKDNSELGTWEQKNAIGGTNFSGTATVFKRAAVNTYLDPAVWRVKELVASGQTYQFPLYATMTINYRPEYTAGCADCKKSVTLPIAILANGDVTTNVSNVTNFVDSSAACAGEVTMSNGEVFAQKVIGTIRAAYPSSNGNDFYISPSILLSGEQYGMLDGTLVGIGEPIKINLAGVRNVRAGERGSINATSAELGDSDTRSAIWANTYNSFTRLRVEYAAANDEAEDKDKNLVPVTEAEKRAANQDFGTVQINTSPCYTVYGK